MNWRVIFALVRKDITDAVRNYYILFGLLLPIGMWLMFKLIFPSDDEVISLRVVVFDPGSSQLVTDLGTVEGVELLRTGSADQVPEQVERNAVGGLALPLGFDDAIKSGDQPTLEIFINRRRGGGEIAHFQRVIEERVWGLVGEEFPARLSITDLATPPGANSGGGFRFDTYLLVLFLVMGLSMTGAFVVPTLVVEEKEKHTLDALLVSPGGPAEVVTGKAITGMVYSIMVVVVLMTLGDGWVGDWHVSILVLFLGALFIVGIGLLMGTLFSSSSQVNTWSSLVMLVLMAPSWIGVLGSETPLDLPLRLLPTKYLVQALDLSLAEKATVSQLALPVGILLGSLVVVYTAVIWALPRRA